MPACSGQNTKKATTPPLSINGTAQLSLKSPDNTNISPVEINISKMEIKAGAASATNSLPAKFEATFKGTADFPEEIQQRTGLPKRFEFELQIRTESKPLTQNPLLSRVEGTYSLLVKQPDSTRVYLNLTNTFSSEIEDTPQNTLQYVNELIGKSLKPLLGFEPKANWERTPQSTPK